MDGRSDFYTADGRLLDEYDPDYESVEDECLRLRAEVATLKAAARRFMGATAYPRSEYDTAFAALAALVGEE